MDRKKFINLLSVSLSVLAFPKLSFGATKDLLNVNSKESMPKIILKEEGKILNVIGDVQMHKILGVDTGNQIVEWTNNVSPGVGIPMHVHTLEDEIFRVIKGEIELTINGNSKILKEGDIAFAPKNIPHAWKVVGDENAQMITSAFPAGIEYLFEELSKLPAGPPDFHKVSEICDKFGVKFV